MPDPEEQRAVEIASVLTPQQRDGLLFLAFPPPGARRTHFIHQDDQSALERLQLTMRPLRFGGGGRLGPEITPLGRLVANAIRSEGKKEE